MELIKSIDDVKKCRVKYTTYEGIKPRWFTIEKDSDGYYIYGHVCGGIPTFPYRGSYVHYWKTFKSVIKAIKRFSKNGRWGFGNFFPKKGERNEN